MAVDIEDLSELLESGDLERGAVNLHTGEVWRSTPLEFRALDENGPDLDDLDEWLLVRGQGSRPATWNGSLPSSMTQTWRAA